MKGQTIIAVSVLVWTIALTSMLFTNNPYLNVVIFGFAALITIGGLSYGCEKIEKAKKKKEQLK